MELKEIIKELTEIRNEALYQLEETDILGAKFEINKIDTLLYKMQKACEGKPVGNTDSNCNLAGIDCQVFCAKAGQFTKWIEEEGLISFWNDENKLMYYYENSEDADITAEKALAMFYEQKNCS